MDQILGCCKSMSCNSYTAALEDPNPQPDLPLPESATLKSEFHVYFSFVIQSSFKVSVLR